MTETNNEYAEAIFMLAAEKGKIDVFSEQLLIVHSLIEENPHYLNFLESPAIPLSKRLSAIDEAFKNGFDEYVISLLKIMCEKGKIKELIPCINQFEALKEFASGITTATVYSAIELSDAQKSKLCEKLSKATNKTVDATYIVKPELIGGIKVELDGKVLDGSLENHLKKLKGVMDT